MPRSTKVIDNKTTPYAVPPFGIIEINNSNSRHTGNPHPKTGEPGQGQLAPILVTNPSNRADRCIGEGGGEEGKSP